MESNTRKIIDFKNEINQLRMYVEKLEEQHSYLLELKDFYRGQYQLYYDLYFDLLEEKEKGENK